MAVMWLLAVMVVAMSGGFAIADADNYGAGDPCFDALRGSNCDGDSCVADIYNTCSLEDASCDGLRLWIIDDLMHTLGCGGGDQPGGQGRLLEARNETRSEYEEELDVDACSSAGDCGSGDDCLSLSTLGALGDGANCSVDDICFCAGGEEEVDVDACSSAGDCASGGDCLSLSSLDALGDGIYCSIGDTCFCAKGQVESTPTGLAMCLNVLDRHAPCPFFTESNFGNLRSSLQSQFDAMGVPGACLGKGAKPGAKLCGPMAEGQCPSGEGCDLTVNPPVCCAAATKNSKKKSKKKMPTKSPAKKGSPVAKKPAKKNALLPAAKKNAKNAVKKNKKNAENAVKKKGMPPGNAIKKKAMDAVEKKGTPFKKKAVKKASPTKKSPTKKSPTKKSPTKKSPTKKSKKKAVPKKKGAVVKKKGSSKKKVPTKGKKGQKNKGRKLLGAVVYV